MDLDFIGWNSKELGDELLDKKGYLDFLNYLKTIDITEMDFSDIAEIPPFIHKQLDNLIKDDYINLTDTSKELIKSAQIVYLDDEFSGANCEVITDCNGRKSLGKIHIPNASGLLAIPSGYHELTHYTLLSNPKRKEINEKFLLTDTLSLFYELIGADKVSEYFFENNRDYFTNKYNALLMASNNLLLNEEDYKNDIDIKTHLLSFAHALVLYDRYQNDPDSVLDITNSVLGGKTSLDNALNKLNIDMDNDEPVKVLDKTYKNIIK